MTVTIEFINRILDSLSGKPLTVYQIGYATGLDYRTVRSYLNIIELAQTSKKIKREITGSRIKFTKER